VSVPPTTAPSATALRTATSALATPALIRLISEIADHGPIPRPLGAVLADQPHHHLRRATSTARALGLVHKRPGAGLDLTPAGAELADLYDALARWARHRDLPSARSDFTARVQHTLTLLLTPDGTPRPQTDPDLADLHEPLCRWLRSRDRAAHAA
jgi:hypothetical protein